MQPRGVRNNNPGNIDRTVTPWQGEDRSADARIREKRFAVFTTPVYGFRALARTLVTYQTKHRLRTVFEIINRWAPPTENDTNAYAFAVAKAVGVSPDQRINVMRRPTMFRLVKAIARHEQGRDAWPDDVIEQGLDAAGIRE